MTNRNGPVSDYHVVLGGGSVPLDDQFLDVRVGPGEQIWQELIMLAQSNRETMVLFFSHHFKTSFMVINVWIWTCIRWGVSIRAAGGSGMAHCPL